MDLKTIASVQLQRSGVSRIEIMPHCTLCDIRFHSYRRNGSVAGRLASVIGLNDPLATMVELWNRTHQ